MRPSPRLRWMVADSPLERGAHGQRRQLHGARVWRRGVPRDLPLREAALLRHGRHVPRLARNFATLALPG